MDLVLETSELDTAALHQGEPQSTPPEGGAPEGHEGTPPAPERPWRRPQPTMVPLERFNEKVKEYHSKAEEAAVLRRTLEDPVALEKHLESLRAKQPTAPGAIQLDVSKFTDPRTGEFDGEGYMRERDRLVAESVSQTARQEAMQAFSQAREAEAQSQAVVQLNQSFRAQVAESSKANPEIAEAVAYLDQVANAGYIPGEVQLALLQSAPEVAYAIACDTLLLEQIARGNPVRSLMQIGRLQALHEARVGVAAGSGSGELPPFQPGRTPGLPQARTAPVPRTLSGASGGGTNPSKMSQSEYNRLRSEGKL